MHFIEQQYLAMVITALITAEGRYIRRESRKIAREI